MLGYIASCNNSCYHKNHPAINLYILYGPRAKATYMTISSTTHKCLVGILGLCRGHTTTRDNTKKVIYELRRQIKENLSETRVYGESMTAKLRIISRVKTFTLGKRIPVPNGHQLDLHPPSPTRLASIILISF